MALNLGRKAYPERSDRIIPNVLSDIILIDNDISRAGFIRFWEMLRKTETKQEKITWDEDEFSPIIDTTSAAVSSTTTTVIPVTNPSYYLPGEIWQNKTTLEIFQVKEVNLGTGNIVVKRAVTALNSSGGTAAATMSSGDQLNRIASLVGENSSRQITRTTTPTENFNYCQQYRKDLSLSRRQIKRQMLNENEMPREQEKMLKEFRMDLDKSALFSQRARYTDTDTGDDVTINGGVKSFITTNSLDVGGTLFKSDLDDWLLNYAMRFGTDKVLICSTALFSAMTQMVDSISQINVPASGFSGKIMTQVKEYTAPNGHTMMIVEDRNISEQFQGEGYVVDMNELELHEFTNNGYSGSMTFIPDTQDPDDLGWNGTVIGDSGLVYGYEKAHGIIKNVSGGSFSVSIA
jgi:hypothetical protein